jgi:hypothetical protein
VTIKFGTKLPKKDDRNGLGRISTELLRSPEKRHMAIVVLDTAKITKDLEQDDVYPTVRIVAIEPIVNGDVARLRTMLQRAYEERTGNMELPADWEAVLAEMATGRQQPIPGADS